MVGNWRERKESGVDTKEGTIKVSVLKAVLFLWRGLKPPVDICFQISLALDLLFQKNPKTSIVLLK